MLGRFLAAVRVYCEERERQSIELNKRLLVAQRFKGQIFYPEWWRDRGRRIWWPITVPMGTGAGVPFITLYRGPKDAFALHPPPPDEAESAIDCIEQEWPWRKADEGHEDSYTIWNTVDKILRRSVIFARYLVRHEDQILVWVNKHQKHSGDGARNLWDEFEREFKIRAGFKTNEPLYETKELQKVFAELLRPSFN